MSERFLTWKLDKNNLHQYLYEGHKQQYSQSEIKIHIIHGNEVLPRINGQQSATEKHHVHQISQ